MLTRKYALFEQENKKTDFLTSFKSIFDPIFILLLFNIMPFLTLLR